MLTTLDFSTARVISKDFLLFLVKNSKKYNKRVLILLKIYYKYNNFS